jgi:hypothetical protein
MREEPLGVAQEGALALHPSELLQKGEGDDLRVREVFEGFVAVRSARVEGGVGVINEAEEHAQSLFQAGEGGGMLGLGQLTLLVVGSWMALSTPKPRNSHLGASLAPARRAAPLENLIAFTGSVLPESL